MLRFVFAALVGTMLLFAGNAQAQQQRGSYDSMTVMPNGSTVWSPMTQTPYGPVYDPSGFFGHQYNNPYGVGNNGIPQFLDSNPQFQTWPYNYYYQYPY